MTEPKLSIENKMIDIPDLNRFRIGDHVIAEATFDHDRHEGVIIGIDLVRVYGSISLTLQPSITLLHGGDQIADGFFPDHLTKVHSDPPPESNVVGSDEADARRYRWLKMQSSAGDQVRIMQSTPWTQWDAAIDAAMQVAG